MSTLRAVSIGTRVKPHRIDGTVHSVFADACNIEGADGEIFTLLSSRKPDQPGGIRLALPEGFAFGDRLSAGDRVSCRSGFLRVGDRRFIVDLRHAKTWSGRLPSARNDAVSPISASNWRAAADAFLSMSPTRAREKAGTGSNLRVLATIKSDSFRTERCAPLTQPSPPTRGRGPKGQRSAPGPSPTKWEREGPAQREGEGNRRPSQRPSVMIAGIARAWDFADALTRALREKDREAARGAMRSLIGCGPGLTPWGDDFVVGFLAGYECLSGDREGRRELSRLRRLCCARVAATSDISRSILLDAIAGRYGMPVHALCEAIFSPVSSRCVVGSVRVLMEIGDSSGEATCYGVLSGIAAAASSEALLATLRR